MDLLNIATWLSAGMLSLGYWLQIYKIHKHKEVRDLSLSSYILFAVAYILLGIEANNIDSTLFLVKNVLVLIPTVVIISQIIYHKNDNWV